MSEPKVQLIDPQGNITVSGLSAVGVLTASSLDGILNAGSATGLTGNPNLDVGVVTASTFTGQGEGHAANLTGTPQLNLGIVTATGFVGDAVGKAAGLTGTPNLNVGLVTATSFVGDVTGAITGNVQGNLTGNIDGNVTGDVTGDVQGDVTGDVDGDVTGNITGDIQGDVDGDVTGNITGNIQGNVTGDVTGNLQGNVQGNVVGNLAGDVTGDVTGNIQGNVTGNVTGNLQGDVTGDVTGDIAGNVTGNVVGNLQGDVTGDVTGDIEGNVTGNVVGNLQGNVTGDVTGEVSGLAGALGINGINVWTGAGTSNLGVGVCTALQLYGDGSALTGTASSAYIAQNVTATGANTTIDLSNGNVIYYDATSNTTVAFSNPSVAEQITLIRDVDNDYTITWPDSVQWNGDTAPTIVKNTRAGSLQVLHFTTGDSGTTYQAWEEMVYNDQTNRLYAWGNNQAGSLGQNDRTQYSSPVLIPGTWAHQQTSFTSMRGIKTDGTLWTWGRSFKGGLGLNQGGTITISSPTQISGTTWSSFITGFSGQGAYEGGAALKTDGTLWMWGSQSYGQLGVNNRTQYSSPVLLAAPSGTWDKQAMAECSTAQIKDGKLYMAGRNNEGGLGLNDGTQRSSPTQVGTNTNWANIKLGDYGTAAFGVKTDGTLWSWGYNRGNAVGILGHNQGGDSPSANISSPKQVGTETTWSTADNKLHVTYRAVSAIKTDGTYWNWGNNIYAALGQNQGPQQVNAFSSPCQIPGTNWASCGRGSDTGWGIKTDGSLWGWGRNDRGMLAQNSVNNGYSSPMQIPGTNWSNITGGSEIASVFDPNPN